MRARVVRTPARCAVLLNARAKGWSGTIHEAVQRYVSPQDLFLTDTFHQARRTIDRLLASDYDAIFAGGGDGTIVYLINEVEERIRQGKIAREDAPHIGVLRLGTGNALATYLGADDIIADLRALRAGAQLSLHDVNMIEGAEGLFPFAGVGWDADILNDYDVVKELARSTQFEHYITGLGGYAAAIASRSIPRIIGQPPLQVTITNLGERALQINYQGDVLREFARGEIIYQGPARICSCASVPFWGFQVRMFPNADRLPDFVQMRCYFGTVPYVLTHLRDFWRGKLPESYIFDCLIQHVHVEIDGEPVPYQVSGDAAGVEREVEWKIAPHPAQLAIPLA